MSERKVPDKKRVVRKKDVKKAEVVGDRFRVVKPFEQADAEAIHNVLADRLEDRPLLSRCFSTRKGELIMRAVYRSLGGTHYALVPFSEDVRPERRLIGTYLMLMHMDSICKDAQYATLPQVVQLVEQNKRYMRSSCVGWQAMRDNINNLFRTLASNRLVPKRRMTWYGSAYVYGDESQLIFIGEQPMNGYMTVYMQTSKLFMNVNMLVRPEWVASGMYRGLATYSLYMYVNGDHGVITAPDIWASSKKKLFHKFPTEATRIAAMLDSGETPTAPISEAELLSRMDPPMTLRDTKDMFDVAEYGKSVFGILLNGAEASRLRDLVQCFFYLDDRNGATVRQLSVKISLLTEPMRALPGAVAIETSEGLVIGEEEFQTVANHSRAVTTQIDMWRTLENEGMTNVELRMGWWLKLAREDVEESSISMRIDLNRFLQSLLNRSVLSQVHRQQKIAALFMVMRDMLYKTLRCVRYAKYIVSFRLGGIMYEEYMKALVVIDGGADTNDYSVQLSETERNFVTEIDAMFRADEIVWSTAMADYVKESQIRLYLAAEDRGSMPVFRSMRYNAYEKREAAPPSIPSIIGSDLEDDQRRRELLEGASQQDIANRRVESTFPPIPVSLLNRGGLQNIPQAERDERNRGLLQITDHIIRLADRALMISKESRISQAVDQARDIGRAEAARLQQVLAEEETLRRQGRGARRRVEFAENNEQALEPLPSFGEPVSERSLSRLIMQGIGEGVPHEEITIPRGADIRPLQPPLPNMDEDEKKDPPSIEAARKRDRDEYLAGQSAEAGMNAIAEAENRGRAEAAALAVDDNVNITLRFMIMGGSIKGDILRKSTSSKFVSAGFSMGRIVGLANRGDIHEALSSMLTVAAGEGERGNVIRISDGREVRAEEFNTEGGGHLTSLLYGFTLVFARGYEDVNQPFIGQVVAHFSGLRSSAKSLRGIVKTRGYLEDGLCLYEAWLCITIRCQIPPNCLVKWREDVYTNLYREKQMTRDLALSGNVHGFLSTKYDETGICVCYYTTNDRKFSFVAENCIGKCISSCMVIHSGHVYTAEVIDVIHKYEKVLMQETNWMNALKTRALTTAAALVAQTKTLQTNKATYCLKRVEYSECSSASLYKKKDDGTFAKYKEDEDGDDDSGSNNGKAPPPRHVHHVLDIETYNVDSIGNQKEYLICVKELGEDKPVYKFYGEGCAVNFVLEYVLALTKRPVNERHHIWTYGGANFDWRFLVRPLGYFFGIKIVGTRLSYKSIKITDRIDTLDLWCWYASMPFKSPDDGKTYRGLEGLAKMCGTKHQKTHMDVAFSSITRDMVHGDNLFKQKACEYCANDILVLEDLINVLVVDAYEKFEYKGRRAFNPRQTKYPCSAASLALHMYKQCFMEEGLELYGSSSSVWKIEKESYHGGLVLVLGPYGFNVNSYDICSSYPSQMTKPMPYKVKEIKVIGQVYTSKMIKSISETSLYTVSDVKFHPNTYIPNITVSHLGRLITPLHNKETISIWGCELKLSLEMSATMFVHSEIKYETHVLFREYVNYFYGLKATAKEKTRIAFYKLLLNSLYGKFGQRLFDRYVYGGNDCALLGLITGKTVKCHGVEDFDCKENDDDDADEKNRGVGGLVRFAAYITAQARTLLIRAACSVKDIRNVIYGDTDSLYIANGDSPSPEFLGSTLGKFKKETPDGPDGAYNVMMVYGSKSYVCYKLDKKTGKDTPVMQRFKGIRGATEENLHSLLKGESARVEMTNVFKKMPNGIQVTKMVREVSDTISTKRVIIYKDNKDGGANDFDSRPFIDKEEFGKSMKILTLQRSITNLEKPKSQTDALPETPAVVDSKKAIVEILKDIARGQLELTKAQIVDAMKLTSPELSLDSISAYANRIATMEEQGKVDGEAALDAYAQLAMACLKVKKASKELIEGKESLESLLH
jgi:hypothetical protein